MLMIGRLVIAVCQYGMLHMINLISENFGPYSFSSDKTRQNADLAVVYLYVLLLGDILEVETVLHFTSLSSARFMQFKQCFKAC